VYNTYTIHKHILYISIDTHKENMMNAFYGDHVLARSIAQERTYHRESIQLATVRNPLSVIDDLVSKAVEFVKAKLQEPNLVPVYCFEYAPDC
jgi:hypothetical protein